MSSFIRRTLHLTAAVGLSVVTLASTAVGGVMVTTSQAMASTPLDAGRVWPTPGASNPAGPIVVAVALGATPTVASDFLAPYEVFASSPQFSVYAVAASAAPAQLEGGPAVLPVHTFDQVKSGAAPSPDVVVVPAVHDPAGTKESALRTFIVDQSNRGARILGICSGSLVLAATGVLDGLQATSHWSRISALEESRPQVDWVRGQRYVQDGLITTTAGVTSGIPGALRVMADLAGPAEAERVGRTLNYPEWSLEGSADIPNRSFAVADAPVGLNAILPWFRPTLGIGLSDGDREIDIAGIFEVFNVSFAARAVAMSTDGTITTRHGLVLLTTALSSGHAVHRMIILDARQEAEVSPEILDRAAENSITIDTIIRSDGQNGFDAALTYLARDADEATAQSAAKMIDYPTDHLTLSSDGTSLRAPFLLIVSVLVAIGVGFLPAAVRRAVRRRRLHKSHPGASVQSIS
ncbi:DJ-1/PfpI family protein [Diaminobutyricimonas sp. TR449]|uniref:DJ-1/PfpI family protein n=1 Tax=Diaminobutyricimonas sp. TR449 TaxID=2708076 RepID=UPI001420CC73|nr:DJ-1/PfpI family protein [Diaminobutyricimonas sp. TR449]